ncbi:hypothetical protein ACYEXS_19775 [Paenibacillus sp. MAH-36]|uniref:Uncharacterized protein n=1 Tax=Paenibacillus violae TaxID=3077234 RepID=A0ABU3R7D6_9BACL|nr:hypothetical protein [Paenibacillus sp. PFR10]MDU0200183.1 hypothetical protein [Paenibacillus sp. PFR10]
MEYRVMHKKTGEESTLSYLDVNDMLYDDAGKIIVFDTSMEAYILLDNE